MKSLIVAFCVAAFGLMTPNSASAGILLTVSTDITGGNTQLDVNHTSVWNFALGTGVSFEDILGSFVLKRGPRTDQNVVFSLWGGSDMTGGLIASTEKAPSALTQSFDTYLFKLDDVNIGPGNYSLSLSSITGDQGNKQYFIKGGADSLTFDQSLAVVLAPTAGTLAPEPTSLALAGFAGLGMLGGALRRRRAVKAAA